MFSVVVPTFERPDILSRCLESLAPHRQTIAQDRYEVIVSDAGTKVTAASLVRDRYSWARWVAAPGRWPGANRNLGATCARGEWVVFLDDDCTVARDFLARLDSRAGPQLDVIEGRVVCPDARDQPLAVCPYNETGGLFWTSNLTVRRERFFAIGAFDEELGRLEDMEFAYRIGTLGLRTVFAADAPAYHPRQVQTLGQYWRRSLLRRWTLLYRIKTRQTPPLAASVARALGALVAIECVGLFRTTYHLVSRHDPARWRMRLFAELWKWVTFPVMLPYLMWWEVQFRRQASATPVHTANRRALP